MYEDPYQRQRRLFNAYAEASNQYAVLADLATSGDKSAADSLATAGAEVFRAAAEWTAFDFAWNDEGEPDA